MKRNRINKATSLEEAAKQLATNVIVLAVQDHKIKSLRAEVEEFFRSSLFDFWAELAHLDPDAAREARGKAWGVDLRRTPK